MIFNYRDPVHDLIQFHKKDEKLFIDLINCKEMQRLRRIKQLGMSFYTYAGAEHSRFTHSIGAAHIMKRVINKLASLPTSNPQKQYISDIQEYQDVAICSAILHDIGHGPFSHALEKLTNKKHEVWSQEIILNEKSEVNQVLRNKNSELPQQVNDVIKRIFKEKYIVKLLSSQLDVDRFDYLIRDSLATGTNYGIFDLEWMLQVLRVGELENGDIEVGVNMDKGLSAVESFVLARRAMYLQVYYHKTTRGAEVLAENILKRAADLLKESVELFATDAVKKLLLGEDLTIDEYFSLDDTVLLFHFSKWTGSSDKIISDLSTRFLNRRLFKAVAVDRNKFSLTEWPEKWQEVLKKLKEKNFDPKYYLESDQAEQSTYKDYYLFSKKKQEKKQDKEATEDIYLFDNKGNYDELSTKSNLISAVRNTTHSIDRVYYPHEVRKEVDQILI